MYRAQRALAAESPDRVAVCRLQHGYAGSHCREPGVQSLGEGLVGRDGGRRLGELPDNRRCAFRLFRSAFTTAWATTPA